MGLLGFSKISMRALGRKFCSAPKLPEDPSLSPFTNLNQKTFFLKTYGCQMNSNDSLIVTKILASHGMIASKSMPSDLVLLNTCAVRENAESKIRSQVTNFKREFESSAEKPLIGILGCMAERLKDKLVEELKVDLVVGPDAYRDLPRLVDYLMGASNNSRQNYAINTKLSLEETYGDIRPVIQEGVSAGVSITRGCNNMCSFCIVPFVRGVERSRSIDSILEEVADLAKNKIKDITFLGQNVNSYFDTAAGNSKKEVVEGFDEISRSKFKKTGSDFSDLLTRAAQQEPNIRFRFISPHPKDFSDRTIDVIAEHPNICRSIHLPLQSGSTPVLERMNRRYSAEAFLNLARKIQQKVPGVSLTTDIIVGFCGETEEQFQETLDLYKQVGFDSVFPFAYSVREKTVAHRTLADDVPPEVKKDRLNRLINLASSITKENALKEIGRTHIVLLDREDNKPGSDVKGKTDTFKTAVARGVPEELKQFGTFVKVKIEEVSGITLIGKFVGETTIQDFARESGGRPFITN